MKYLILAAGAVALGLTVPAAAKPGHGHGNAHAYGHGNVHAYGYGAGACPPGLAKKAVPCVPPGQAKKMYNVGQRFRSTSYSRYSYRQIPYSLRSQYRLDPYDRYYYSNGYLYRVDPRTMLVQQVVAALLGR